MNWALHLKNLLFSVLLLVLVSCQTTKVDPSAKASAEGGGGAKDQLTENVGDAIGMGETEDDLESEFVDSEDFEKEIAESAYPDQLEKENKTSKSSDTADAEDVEDAEAESTLVDEDDLLEEDSEPPATEEEKSQQIAETDSTPSEELDSDSSDSGAESTDSISESNLESSAEDSGFKSPVVINSIRYQASENKIIIEGQDTLSYQSRENTDENQLVIEIPGAILADHLKFPFIMKDFNTQMAFLQADQKDDDNVRVVIQMRKNSTTMPSITVSDTGALIVSTTTDGHTMADSNSATQSGEDFAFTDANASGGEGGGKILPAQSLEEFFLQTPQYKGRPISVHLKDVDVRDVLYFISEGTGLNMVISEGVSGKVSVKLRKVPWDQVLLTIIKTKKLGYLREGNVIRIMTLESLKAHQQEIQKMIRSQRTLEPQMVKVIPITYAEVDQIKQKINNFLTKAGAESGQQKGQVVVDQNTNSLIITDTKDIIRKIESLIKHLDQSPTQVMIEAKIVEARETFVRNLGIGWLFNGTPLNIQPNGNSNLALNLTGGIDAFPTLRGAGGRTIKTRNLSFSFAPVGRLDAVLDLSESINTAHILSSPRVVVLNGEEATIRQTTETIDVATQASANGQAVGTNARRNPVILEFKVKPKITSVGTVFMDITMQRDFPGGVEDPGTGARPVNSRTASTKVLVKNGQTLVIGGIYQIDKTRGDEGLPILKHIPIIKWLFNRYSSDQAKNELLLFVTPRVMNFSQTTSQASNQ